MTARASPPPRESRSIPEPIKREVRQRCGFGCVFCGLPLYEYEHMEEWATVKRHVSSEITLLCDQHHREKTAGLLPKHAVREANANPRNLQVGSSQPYGLHYSGPEVVVEIGGSVFTQQFGTSDTDLYAVGVDGITLVGFCLTQGRVLLTLNAFDEYNKLGLIVRNNELIQTTRFWDIQFVGRKLTVREAFGRIFLDIEFDPPNRISINRGRLLCNGVELLISEEKIIVKNTDMTISNLKASRVPGGLLIGRGADTLNCLVSLPDIPRYPQT